MHQRDITATKITTSDRNRWNELLGNSQYGSYQNSYEFTYAKNAEIRQTESFIFSIENEDFAGVHYTLKSALIGLVKTADVLSGVVMKNISDTEVLSFIIQHFLSWAKKKRAAYCRFSPWFPALTDDSKFDYTDNVDAMFRKSGFQSQRQGRSTYWIDLSLEQDSLLNKMNAGTRRKIKKGMDSGADIKLITSVNPEAVQSFWELYYALGKKKGFVTLSEKRFKREVDALLGANQATLMFLYYQDQIINISLVTHAGMGMYYHGAVNHEAKLPPNAPSAGHLMHWQMMLYLKGKGYKYYDMAFCPGPTPLKEHPMFDMWRFKHGFGGQYVEFMPTYTKSIHPLKGLFIKKLLNQ